MTQKSVIKVILALFSFLIGFFLVNGIVASIIGCAQTEVFSIISELMSGNTLTGTGPGIVAFVIIMSDGIGGLAGFLGMYFYLADKILGLFPFSVNGDE